MEEQPDQQKNLIDTTDSLEAIAVFRGWKNFLFVVLLLCMIGIQVGFWLLHSGNVNKSNPKNCVAGGVKVSMLAATENTAEAETTDSSKDSGQPNEKSEQQKPVEKEQIQQAAKKVAGDANATQPAAEQQVQVKRDREKAEQTGQAGEQTEPQAGAEGHILNFGQFGWFIRFFNWIAIFAALLYCLTLLFSLKVSLTGRLGGINHIARAFYWSLLFAVLLLPWQKFFAGVFTGYLATPHEMLSASLAVKDADMLAKALFYIRYVGFWVVLLILLFVAQSRSSKWIKATYHRLEVI
jgi:hypothetical protein